MHSACTHLERRRIERERRASEAQRRRGRREPELHAEGRLQLVKFRRGAAFDLQLAPIGGEQMNVDDAVDDAPRL